MDRASLLSGHGAPGSSDRRGSSASVKSGSTLRRGSLFAFDTEDTLQFRRWRDESGVTGLRAMLKARNRAETHVAFKCKTNNRERYRVEPNRFLVKGGLETTITITVSSDAAKAIIAKMAASGTTEWRSQDRFRLQLLALSEGFATRVVDLSPSSFSRALASAWETAEARAPGRFMTHDFHMSFLDEDEPAAAGPAAAAAAAAARPADATAAAAATAAATTAGSAEEAAAVAPARDRAAASAAGHDADGRPTDRSGSEHDPSAKVEGSPSTSQGAGRLSGSAKPGPTEGAGGAIASGRAGAAPGAHSGGAPPGGVSRDAFDSHRSTFVRSLDHVPLAAAGPSPITEDGSPAPRAHAAGGAGGAAGMDEEDGPVDVTAAADAEQEQEDDAALMRLFSEQPAADDWEAEGRGVEGDRGGGRGGRGGGGVGVGTGGGGGGMQSDSRPSPGYSAGGQGYGRGRRDSSDRRAPDQHVVADVDEEGPGRRRYRDQRSTPGHELHPEVDEDEDEEAEQDEDAVADAEAEAEAEDDAAFQLGFGRPSPMQVSRDSRQPYPQSAADPPANGKSDASLGDAAKASGGHTTACVVVVGVVVFWAGALLQAFLSGDIAM